MSQQSNSELETVSYQRRRVVVTGIGLLCGVGKTVPEVWSGLLAGIREWRQFVGR